MSKKLQKWLASEQVRLAKNSETRLELEPHATVLTEDQVIAALKMGRLTLDRVLIEMLTPRVCLAALKCGFSIRSLTDAQRTQEVCLAAVQRYGSNVFYLTDAQRSNEICLAAVQQDGYAIQYLNVQQRTPGVCLSAVQRHGGAIEYLTEAQRSPEVCLAAVSRWAPAIQFLSDAQRTPQVCVAAMTDRGGALRYLTPAQCAQPLISDWIEANWEACIEILGRDRAREVAQAILAARQADAEGAQPTYEQARA